MIKLTDRSFDQRFLATLYQYKRSRLLLNKRVSKQFDYLMEAFAFAWFHEVLHPLFIDRLVDCPMQSDEDGHKIKSSGFQEIDEPLKVLKKSLLLLVNRFCLQVSLEGKLSIVDYFSNYIVATPAAQREPAVQHRGGKRPENDELYFELILPTPSSIDVSRLLQNSDSATSETIATLINDIPFYPIMMLESRINMLFINQLDLQKVIKLAVLTIRRGLNVIMEAILCRLDEPQQQEAIYELVSLMTFPHQPESSVDQPPHRKSV